MEEALVPFNYAINSCTINPARHIIKIFRKHSCIAPVLIYLIGRCFNQYRGMKQLCTFQDYFITWQNLPEKDAMEKSVELVYQYAKAGFTKIHLDTSMKVADDPEGLLSTETIARRGAELYKASIKGYEELKSENPDAVRPVFIIGSEVPIPGGAQEAEDSLAVTSPAAFQDTVATYKRIFEESGVGEGWKDVVAVVVQPGVEFGDDQVFLYNHDAATELCSALKEYPEVCFEGHSTDYQSAECLKSMVQDGIAILKVGPALQPLLPAGRYNSGPGRKNCISLLRRAACHPHDSVSASWQAVPA